MTSSIRPIRCTVALGISTCCQLKGFFSFSTRRCGGVYLGVEEKGVSEVFYVYYGCMSSAVVLYILGVG